MISVIICTYNRAALLADALQSVCEQRLDQARYEVIVVDNNSTDHTPAVVDAFAQHYPQIRYCREPQQGISSARNRGWREAKGEYVAYIDDDCKAPPEWLQVAQTIIQQQKPLEFGGPALAYCNTTKPVWWRDTYDAYYSLDRDRPVGYLPAEREIYGCNLFLQRAILTQMGGFNPALGVNGDKLAYGEETELHARLCALLPEHRAYFDPKLYVYHLLRPEKLSPWWHLHSFFMHGQANYAIAPQRQYPFSWWQNCLFPFYVLVLFGFTWLCSWLWRDRGRYPFWQNYFYEAQHLHVCVHRLGGWSVAVQERISRLFSQERIHAA